jgi:membrane protease YdiL (CAAX protease family)
MADERPGWPIAAIVTVLVVVNVGMNRGLPSWAYVPWAVGWTGALVWFARRVDGRSWSDLGLARADAPRGLRWGAVLGGMILVIYLVGFAVPGTRELFLDERVHGWSLGETAFAALVRVPLGTVLIEEVAFRAVLPAMAAARWSRAVSVAFASVLFGLWHLLPALGIADVNPVTADSVGDLPTWVSVTGAVVSTAIVGAWFWWLRARSGSVLAPMALHWSTNGLGYLFAYLAWRW